MFGAWISGRRIQAKREVMIWAKEEAVYWSLGELAA